MIRFIARRLLSGLFVLWATSVAVFGIFQLAPLLSNVSPVYYYTGKVPPTGEQMQLLMERFGFNLPITEQYWNWVKGIAVGQTITDGTSDPVICHAPCLGYSFRQNQLVNDLVADAIPVSVSVAFGAAILWIVVGVGIGTASGLKRGTFVDRAGMIISLAGVSLPVFFTGPLLLLLFVYQTKWLPDVSYVSITDDPVQWFKSMILPWTALAFALSALYARITRASVLETLGEDFVRTARAKGIGPARLVRRHVLRPAVMPILTILSMDLGTLVGSMIITETVFNLRGLGWLSYTAIKGQDLPVMMGVTIVAALFLVIANIVTDVLAAALDPRISRS